MISTDNVYSLFEPDPAVIRSHLERLFRRARLEYPEGLCEIAWADGTGQVNSANSFPITPEGLDEATECAIRHNCERRNVYVGPNPRKPGGAPFGRAKAHDVEVSFFQWVEIDNPEGTTKLRKAPLTYTFAVTTGRIPNPRVHGFWELEEPIRNMPAWSAQQKALESHFNGDAMSNPDRIMRLAGTVNYPSQKKIERGYRTELVTIRLEYDGEERDPVSSEALYHAYPWAHANERVDSETGEVHEDAARGTAEAGSSPNFDTDGEPRLSIKERLGRILAGQQWHNNVLSLIAHMVNRGDPDALILALAPAITLAGYTVSQTHAEMSSMLNSARRNWSIPNNDDEDFSSYSGINGKPLPLEWFADIQPSLDASDFVEGLLCNTGLSVVYGESNCGKTFFMTDLAFHIATGRRWRDRGVEKGGVIYVALEGGFGIRNRLAALRIHYATGSQEIPFGIVPCSINMLDANADTGPLIQLINDAAKHINIPVRLVVIDTLARAINGGNENAPEDMGKLIKSADRIREQTGSHVVFIHHSGKDQARGARGHSSLRAATDTEIEITRNEESSYSIATVTKQRELEIEGKFAFSLEQVTLGTNKRGKPLTSCIVVEAEAPEQTAPRKKLTDHEYSYMREIRELMNREGTTEMIAPEPGMPVLKTLKKDVLRDWLVKRGKLAVSDGVTDGVTVISNAERQRLHRVLTALTEKGFIEMNQTRIWMLQ